MPRVQGVATGNASEEADSSPQLFREEADVGLVRPSCDLSPADLPWACRVLSAFPYTSWNLRSPDTCWRGKGREASFYSRREQSLQASRSTFGLSSSPRFSARTVIQNLGRMV